MRERNPAECASVVAGDRGDYAHIPVTSLACPVGDRGFDGGVPYEQEVGETDHEVIVRDTQPPTAERDAPSGLPARSQQHPLIRGTSGSEVFRQLVALSVRDLRMRRSQ